MNGEAKAVPFCRKPDRTFLRHFDESLEHAAELAKMKPELDAKGVLLVVVGVGTPESGKTFCESLPFPEELRRSGARR